MPVSQAVLGGRRFRSVAPSYNAGFRVRRLGISEQRCRTVSWVFVVEFHHVPTGAAQSNVPRVGSVEVETAEGSVGVDTGADIASSLELVPATWPDGWVGVVFLFRARSPSGRLRGYLGLVTMDKRSDDVVYKAHADELVRFATGLVGPDDAPDVVVDAFVQLVASKVWDNAQDRRALWYRAVIYRARSWRRSTARRLAREQAASLMAGPPVGSVERDEDVMTALAGLSVQQRAVVVLTYWADLSPADVGELIGVSGGSVKKQLSRARRKLRGVLDNE